MSWVRCEDCGCAVNSDNDPDCFCYVRDKERVLCSSCRDWNQAVPYWEKDKPYGQGR